MYNHVMLVGRIKQLPVLNESQEYVLIVKVTSNFRSNEGRLEVRDFKLLVWKGLAESVLTTYKCSDLVVVTGRLELRDDLILVRVESLSSLES